jgi:hypothetical protein
MRLSGVETRIEMREGDRDQPLRPHDLCGLDDKPRRQLHGLAMVSGKLRAGVVGQVEAQGFTCSCAMRFSVW